MAVVSAKEDRAIFDDGVQVRLRRQPAGKWRVLPAASGDPGFIRILFGEIGDARDHFCDRLRLGQVYFAQASCPTQEVNVRVVETRRDQFAAQINYLSVLADQLSDFSRRADPDDLVAAKCNRFGEGSRIAACPDAAIDQRPIGGFSRGSSSG